MPTSYRIYINHTIDGPYNIDELLKLENLSKETLVCEVGDIEWQSVGSCQSIQQQLAYQPLKWGAVQQTLFSGSGAPSDNSGSARNVSISGDSVQGPSRPAWTPKSKSAPVKKKTGKTSWISTLLHGPSQKQ